MADNTLSRRTLLAISAGTTLGYLTGCGGGNGGNGGQAGRGGKLMIATSTDPIPNLVMQANNTNQSWQRLVFNHLTNLDETRQPQPRLATSWTFSDDQLTLTLALRPDVKFHSGRPLTADDVIFSLQQANVPENGSQLASVAGLITDMSKRGNNEVVLKLSEPTSQLFELFQLTPVVDRESLADLGSGAAIGTGPFTWQDWRPGASLTLKRNPDYWMKDRPLLDEVEVLIIKQSQALIAAARSQRAHLTTGLTPLDAGTLRNTANLAVEYRGGHEVNVLGLNASAQPFNNVEVRRAVAIALNRERIAQQVFKGEGKPTNLWYADTTPGWNKDTDTTYTYQPDVARRRLQELGVVGAQIPITVNAGDNEARAIFDIVRFDLEKAGLGPRANIIEQTDFHSRNAAGTLGLAFIHKTGFGSLSPAANASSSLHVKPGGGTHFDSKQYRDLIAAASRATREQPPQANAALGQYMVDQAFNLPLVIWQPPLVRAKSVSDVAVTNAFQYLVVDDAKIG